MDGMNQQVLEFIATIVADDKRLYACGNREIQDPRESDRKHTQLVKKRDPKSLV